MPPVKCCTGLLLVSMVTMPWLGTPSPSGANAAQSKKPPKPTPSVHKPMRAARPVLAGAFSLGAELGTIEFFVFTMMKFRQTFL